MKHQIFTIYDLVAKCYMAPFYQPNQQMAERAFSDCCNTPDHDFNKHPSDYQLICLGEWDNETAEINTTDQITLIGKANDYVKHSGPTVKNPDNYNPRD